MAAQQQIRIYCDFDGTITVGDTVDLLLEKLAVDQWKVLEELWVQGSITSRECMSKQIPLIQGGWKAIEKVLATVELDRGFPAFVAWCRHRSIPFSIVSDGLDRVIHRLLDRESVLVDQVYANHLLDTADGGLELQFPVRPQRVVCSTGQCKCQILDIAPRGTLKVVIGDGRSDFCWARNADILFAKDKLLKYCLDEGIPCYPYGCLLEVRVALEDMMKTEAVSVEHFVDGPACWLGA